jgi:hypothetical protein
VQLKVVTGGLDVKAEGVRFRLSDGAKIVSCFVTHFALQDLGSHHLIGSNTTDLQAFSELLPEIEHLANAKYNAGRAEDDGEIAIGTADLLRHGLQCPGARLEQVCAALADCGVDGRQLEAMISRLGRIGARDAIGAPKSRLRETLGGKSRPRRKAAALFREGLHLRTAVSGSKPSRSNHDPLDRFEGEPLLGMVIEFSAARALMWSRDPGRGE